MTKNWLNEIILSNGKAVYENLSDVVMKKNNNKENCSLLM
jgi:hypothetical protein